MPDWYERATAMCRDGDEALADAPLSSDWRTGRLTGAAVPDLIAIRDQVRNLVRVHGVPPECRVDLATLGQTGAGAAGFEDTPAAFTRPFILLDKDVYLKCPGEPAVNVYCGIALHEAGHILHTRDFYRRLHAGMPDHRRVWENIWEDERIEALVRRDAPGFGPYLDAAKRHLLADGQVGRAVAGWDALPDLDKLNALIFAFVRLPTAIGEGMKRWAPLGCGSAFETLRALFPSGPETESDVVAFAARLEELWDRVADHYPAEADRVAPPEGARERLEQQWAADREDRAAKAAGDGAAGARPGRFAVADARRLLDEQARVGRVLDEAETEELAGLTESDGATDSDTWDWDGVERRTVVEVAAADDMARQRYAAARKAVAGHVTALRAAFARPFATRATVERNLRSGRIDRSRLGRAAICDRLFRRTDVRPSAEFALCLVLDESGSMAGGAAAADRRGPAGRGPRHGRPGRAAGGGTGGVLTHVRVPGRLRMPGPPPIRPRAA